MLLLFLFVQWLELLFIQRRGCEDGVWIGVCRKFCQQVAIVQRLLHQFGRGGAQVVHIFWWQIKTGRNVQYFFPQLGRREVFEVEADEGEADAVGLFVFIPLIDEGTETAQGFLRVLVNGDIDDGGDDVAETGNGRSFVQIAADLVLRIDIDDDDMADVVLQDFVCQDFFRVHFRHIQKATHTQIVGQAAVYQVDVGSVFPVCVFLEALVKFFYGAALLSACFAVVCLFRCRLHLRF